MTNYVVNGFLEAVDSFFTVPVLCCTWSAQDREAVFLGIGLRIKWRQYV